MMSEKRTCNSCGAPISAEDKYCTSCGNKLSPAAISPETDPQRKPESIREQPMQYGVTPQKAEQEKTGEPKKKSAFPIPVLALILIAAVVVVAAFFLLRGGAGNDEKIWRTAEESFFDKNTALGAFHAFSTKHLDAKKTGIVSELSFEVQSIPGLDLSKGFDAEIFKLLNNIVVRTENLSVYDQEKADFSYKLELFTRDSDTSQASINLYTVDDNVILTFPGLFPKSILFESDSADELMSNFNFSKRDSAAGVPGNLFDIIRESGQSLSYVDLDKSIEDLREIYYKYVEVPERQKDIVLNVGGVSETVDCFEAVIPSDKFPEFLLEVLVYVRDDQNFYAFMDHLKALNDSGAESFNLEDYQTLFNNMIEEINLDHSICDAEFRSVIYLNKKNEVRGRELILESHTADDFIRGFVYSELRARNGSENTYTWSLAVRENEESKLLYALDTRYTETDKKLIGDYTMKFGIGVDDQTIIKGRFSDYSLYTKNDSFYPEGQVTIDEIGNSKMDSVLNTVITYEGRVENKMGSDHLIFRLHVRYADDMEEAVDLAVMNDLFIMDPADVKIESVMPVDYVNASDDGAMNKMYSEGESFFVNLIAILESLGVDTTVFD